MALSTARNTLQMGEGDPTLLSVPVATATTIYQGGIVAKNSSGYATPGATSSSLTAIGRAEETVTNAGSNGAKSIQVRRGCFKFANGSSSIAQGDLFSLCYMVDDQTVHKTDGSGTRSIAGLIMQVDSDGIWVAIGLTNALAVGDVSAQLAQQDSDIEALQGGSIQCYRRVFDHADADVALAATTAVIDFGAALPAGAVVLAVHANVTEDWTDGSSGTFSADVGESGGDDDRYTPTALDIDGGIAELGTQFTGLLGTQLAVTFTGSVDLDTATAGKLDLRVYFTSGAVTTIAA